MFSVKKLSCCHVETFFKMLDVYDFLPFDNPDGGAWKQGWNVQRDKNEEHLDVFVVPHSHNDPGMYTVFSDINLKIIPPGYDSNPIP